jgi:hypothetical protein
MKALYHKLMFGINAFLFGQFSTKAHRHLGYLAAYGLKKGFEKAERK